MSKIELPREVFGVDVTDAVKRFEANPDAPPQTTQPQPGSVSPATHINDPENYLILPGKKHGTYEYPEMLIGMHRLGYSQDVERITTQLGITLQDTAKEYDGHGPGFMGNINWNLGLMLNLKLGGKTPNPRQFIDFLEMLKSGIANNGKGQRVSKDKLDQILDEILGVRNPYRAEWLDADFKYLDGQGKPTSSDKTGTLYINYGHQLSNTSLIPRYHEPVESSTLMKDVKIKLSTANRHGLPTEEGTDISYWYPRKDNNSVARFDAYSGRAYLYCSRNPTYSNAGLGVRHARKKI